MYFPPVTGCDTVIPPVAGCDTVMTPSLLGVEAAWKQLFPTVSSHPVCQHWWKLQSCVYQVYALGSRCKFCYNEFLCNKHI